MNLQLTLWLLWCLIFYCRTFYTRNLDSVPRCTLPDEREKNHLRWCWSRYVGNKSDLFYRWTSTNLFLIHSKLTQLAWFVILTVVRADLKELWDLDLQGHVYGYTPFCTSRNTTLGFQFWREGFWKNHLGNKPYHISALYVVDLERFCSNLVGDVLRSIFAKFLLLFDQNWRQHEWICKAYPV